LFDQYMNTAVLGPLGMVQSPFPPLPRKWRNRAATADDDSGKAGAGQWHVYPKFAVAGLWTTPSDLARVVLEIQRAEAGPSEKVLSRDMLSTMLKRGLGDCGSGLFVEDLGDRISFSHSGGTKGFRAQLYG
jgi:CubicO group peptidase (beta-lactamase class C family)